MTFNVGRPAHQRGILWLPFLGITEQFVIVSAWETLTS